MVGFGGDLAEGGHGAPGVVTGHPANNEVERQFYLGKKYLDDAIGWLRLMLGAGMLGDWISNFATESLRNTRQLSNKGIADSLEKASREIWAKYENDGEQNQDLQRLTEFQQTYNDKMWVLNGNNNAPLTKVKSDDVTPLFDPKDKANWPNLVLTSNHARAGKTEDLTELMEGMEQLMRDAWPEDQEFSLHQPKNVETPLGEDAKGKNIFVLACHTEKDICLSGARLLRRRLALQNDPNKDNPALRTREFMSPAAMRLAKLMLKVMVEPDPTPSQDTKLIDLDRATDENASQPFVANAHNRKVVLRADAASIAQHIKLVGYSRGCNTVTDALRFFYQECAALGDRLQVRDKEGKLVAADLARDVKPIISNVGLLNVAPGGLPLTESEKHQMGIRRESILNTNDLTAGHLIVPHQNEYDPWTDHLVQIEGGTDQNGHSIWEALGGKGTHGYIMDPANGGEQNYTKAQDVIRSFFASNHGIHAATTLCLSPDENKQSGNTENALLIQFAPGVTRAEGEGVAQIKQKLVAALQAQGFTNPTVEDDFTHRRRLRVVLDTKGEGQPIIRNDNITGAVNGADAIKVGKCLAALESINDPAKNQLFFTSSSLGYLQELMEKYPPGKHAAGVLSEQGRGGSLGR